MTSNTIRLLRNYFAQLELTRMRLREIKRLVQLRRIRDAARVVC